MAQTWPRARALVTGSDMACPRVWVVARLNGYGVRKGRKEGPATGRNRGKAGSGVAGRVDTGSGQQKAPRGNLRVSGEGLAYLSVPGEGRKRHEEHEESAKQEVSQGAE